MGLLHVHVFEPASGGKVRRVWQGAPRTCPVGPNPAAGAPARGSGFHKCGSCKTRCRATRVVELAARGQRCTGGGLAMRRMHVCQYAGCGRVQGLRVTRLRPGRYKWQYRCHWHWHSRRTGRSGCCTASGWRLRYRTRRCRRLSSGRTTRRRRRLTASGRRLERTQAGSHWHPSSAVRTRVVLRGALLVTVLGHLPPDFASAHARSYALGV